MTTRAHADRFAVVFEDDRLVVVDKASGVPVIETPKKETVTLTQLVNRYLDEKGVVANAYPCHRIDRETSGLVIYAKGKAAQKAVMEEFRARRVTKQYTAFVHGKLEHQDGTLRSRLFNRNKRKEELAVTRYRVIAAREGFTALDVSPVTGRTNQIRRQFSESGHPLVGERVFAFGKDYALKFRRVALHARELRFSHPVTKEEVFCRAELPDDMRRFLAARGVG